MSNERLVSDHYTHGHLIQAIEQALQQTGKSPTDLTIDDLAPIDEFHIGGRLATDHLMQQLPFPKQSHLLDIGCGLGGAARYIASQSQHTITGVDLTEEYINTGNQLSQWLHMDHLVSLTHGSATAMPYYDHTFDGAYMLHVGMNIQDKQSLFNEVARVVKNGSYFGIYDIMQMEKGDLSYPVPWATHPNTSQLASVEHYKKALNDAGFEVLYENNRITFAQGFFQKAHEKNHENNAPSPLGLHLLMQEDTADKLSNVVKNILHHLIAPIELICKKH